MNKSIRSEPSDYPLILVHGAGGSRLSWPPEIRHQMDYSATALNLPGPGRSAAPALTNIKDLGTWVADQLSSPSILVGHSLGGAAVLQAALDEPSRVLGLVLISTGARLPVNPNLLNMLGSPKKYQEAVENILRWCFGKQADPELSTRTRELLLDLPAGLLQADFQACVEFDVRHRLPEIRVPTLVLVGSEDRMTPRSLGEELKTGIRGSRLQIIPGAGHMLPLEAPVETAAGLTNFLASFKGD